MNQHIDINPTPSAHAEQTVFVDPTPQMDRANEENRGHNSELPPSGGENAPPYPNRIPSNISYVYGAIPPMSVRGGGIAAILPTTPYRHVDLSFDENINNHSYNNEENPTALLPEWTPHWGTQKPLAQAFAILQSTCQRLWRAKFSMIAEILVPVLFIVVLIFLDMGFGTGDIQSKNLMANPSFYDALDNDYTYYSCSNYSSGYPITSLPDCNNVAPENLHCDGDESSLPVKGVCSVYSNNMQMIKFYINMLRGRPVAPPPLDSVILHQWFAKKSSLCEQKSYLKLLSQLSVSLNSGYSTHTDSLCTSGYLYIAPSSNVPDGLIEYIMSKSSAFKYVYGGTFDTVAEAKKKLWEKGSKSSNEVWALIVINDLVNGFDVDIQLNSKSLPSLSPVVNLLYRGGFSFEGSELYMISGYYSLQKILYDYFIASQYSRGIIPNDFPASKMYPIVSSFPDIETKRHYLVDITGNLVAFVIILAFAYPFTQMTKRLVLDKETRIQETLLVMGTVRCSLWISFFILAFLEYFLLCILITIGLRLKVTTRSNPLVVFVVLFVYSCTLISFAGVVSTFFSNARVASLFAPMFYFILAAVIFLIDNINEKCLLVLAFLSPMGGSNLLSSILKREGGSGFTMKDFTNPFFEAYAYKVLLILVADFFLYMLLMLYLDQVLPSGGGAQKHPLFFIVPIVKGCRRWFGRRKAQEEELKGNHEEAPHHQPLIDPSVGFDLRTGMPKTPVIQLKQVRKTYCYGKRRAVAVDSLSWVLYQGEVSVLLGPNSSGKSTIVGIITGMIKPDEGDCIVDGHSVLSDLDAVRGNVGLCPQHNTLWPDLTCREHLELFAKLKGFKGAALENAVWEALCAVDLVDKIDYLVSMLSGGQKRKLCVAIAFVGQNRVVVLDEPTAGMDASARRHIWSLLREMSVNRTILLITHYMDETDLLGDHVGILMNGKLQCAGSNLFLRSHSGFGYSLRLNLLPFNFVPNPKSNSTGPTTVDLHGKAGTNEQQEANYLQETWHKLTVMMKTAMRDAHCSSRTDREIVFRIPIGRENEIPGVLRHLENAEKNEIGLRSYALVAPSMEDVFMNVLEASNRNGPTNTGGPGVSRIPLDAPLKPPLSQPQDTISSNPLIAPDHDTSSGHREQNSHLSISTPALATQEVAVNAATLESVWSHHGIKFSMLYYLQLKAVLYRRFICFVRDFRMLAVQIMCPSLCVIIVLGLGLIDLSHTRTLELKPDMFRYPTEIQMAQCLDVLDRPNKEFFEQLGHSSGNVLWTSVNFANGYDMSAYMQDSWFAHSRERYTAVYCGEPVLESFTSMQSELASRSVHLIMYNTSSRHSLPFSQHVWYMIMYLALLKQSGSYTQEEIQQKVFRTRVTSVVGKDLGVNDRTPVESILIGVILLIPLIFMPSNPIKWVVRERYTRALHLQKVSGLNHVIYWISNFIFDFIVYVLSVSLIVVAFVVCGESQLVGSDRIGALVVVFVLYGLCCCFGSYALSFAFREHTSAQVTVIGIGFLTGSIGAVTIFVLSLLPQTKDKSDKMRWILRLLPTYAVGEVIINFELANFSEDTKFDPWSLDQTGFVNIYMTSEVVFFIAFTLLWDHPRRKYLIEHMRRLFVFRRHRTAEISRKSTQEGVVVDDSVKLRSSQSEEPGASHTTLQNINAGGDLTETLPPLNQHHRAGSEVLFGLRNLVKIIPITNVGTTEGIHAGLSNNTLGTSYPGQAMKQIPHMYPASSLDSENLESATDENSDVEMERLEVYKEEENSSQLGVVRLVDIRKRYSSNDHLAVRSLSFSVMAGEVFCFLGTNGAGKSTTISILTQEIMPTSGRAYICGHDVVHDGARAMQCIGYCSQFDTCFDAMNVEEYMRFYALVHGVVEKEHDELVRVLLNTFGLNDYRDVQSCHLSGGNRRKLSLAIAFIGAPKVILLDEPSAGMDPVARRSIWKVLKLASKHCSIILTTHHLEEVEALGECVAIMVDGSLRCIGDLPHLKRKYAQNIYELTIRVDDTKPSEGARKRLKLTQSTTEQSVAPGSAHRNERSFEINNSASHAGLKWKRRPSSIIFNAMHNLNHNNPIPSFMENFFPCALLLENIGDRQYTYSIPSNMDAALEMERMKCHIEQTLGHRTSAQSWEGLGPNFLPRSDSMRHVAKLSDLFEMLQKYQAALHISHFSISHVSLDHVFMQVCNDDTLEARRKQRRRRQRRQRQQSQLCRTVREGSGGGVGLSVEPSGAFHRTGPSLYSISQHVKPNVKMNGSIDNFPHYRRWRAGLHHRHADNGTESQSLEVVL